MGRTQKVGDRSMGVEAKPKASGFKQDLLSRGTAARAPRKWVPRWSLGVKSLREIHTWKEERGNGDGQNLHLHSTNVTIRPPAGRWGCRDAEMSETLAGAARSEQKSERAAERKQRPPDALTSHVQGQGERRWGEYHSEPVRPSACACA